MKSMVNIGILVIAAIMFLFAGTVNGERMGQTAIHEQKAIEKVYVEFKCDPCDYNIDYGDPYPPVKRVRFDEGSVKLECDPCDYNVDHGERYRPTEK